MADNHYPDTYYSGKGSNYILGYHILKHKLFWKSRLQTVRKHKPNGTALDIGCAFGYFSTHLSQTHNCFGMDISKYAINQARKLTPLKDNFKQGNVEQSIPFDQVFDVVTCFDLFEHLENPEKALRNIQKKIGKEGVLILELPIKQTWLDRDLQHHYHDLDYWKKLLEQNTFQPLEEKGYFTLGSRIIMLPTHKKMNYVRLIYSPT